jgi:hypothetical protein
MIRDELSKEISAAIHASKFSPRFELGSFFGNKIDITFENAVGLLNQPNNPGSTIRDYAAVGYDGPFYETGADIRLNDLFGQAAPSRRRRGR